MGCLLDFWTLRMGPIGCPKMSVRTYHYSLHNNPEERSSLHSLCCWWISFHKLSNSPYQKEFLCNFRGTSHTSSTVTWAVILLTVWH
jgi:hypothetical protein